jgi:hypothetical protein
VDALTVVDADRTQQVHGLLILHALGDRLQAEPAREPDDRMGGFQSITPVLSA